MLVALVCHHFGQILLVTVVLDQALYYALNAGFPLQLALQEEGKLVGTIDLGSTRRDLGSGFQNVSLCCNTTETNLLCKPLSCGWRTNWC